ncbi:MAG: bifunctional diaminohydroxyphosphoribosylaminopyrimidine deaminase/5-amino-6-(5-phosphoribosylamino)uracil reductase RibD [Sebaldella sp.]|nr:bifunctional diaminohydroxyphosphoribosylaminopyrimidine deaminase/5-amino-6-(5-phosphoribosylamino)uracil reductase RibD [Sebaldella sp.]
MDMAVELAKNGIGRVNPNPLVGAVIVKDGEVIGKGYHKYYGGPHAEVYALEEAGSNAKGADIYVTLEPCSHYGKTPPCTERVIKSGIKRCFIGSYDSNPLVSGQGIKKLRENNIEVEVGIQRETCDSLNKIFFKYIKEKKPYLFLKCAITLDGKIASRTGDSKWISNELSREKVQNYRSKFMGIMVGINTVLADDPRLTARIENGVDPFRIIIDPHLKIDEKFSIIKNNEDKKTIIITSSDCDKEKQDFLEKKYEIKFLHLDGFDYLLEDIMIEVGRINIDSILLEGGAKLISQAFKEKVIDAGEIFISNKILGDEMGKSFISGFSREKISDSFILENIKYNLYGDNIGVEFEF